MTHTLRLFGTFELNDPTGRPCSDVLSQPKRAAVLAYLAATQPFGYQRRDKLFALFWPDSDQTGARRSLNQAVHFLRQALGRDLIQSRGSDEIGLDLESLVCDTVAFQHALDQGRWADALDYYRGELLDGFFVPNRSEFDEWLDERRTVYRASAVRAAWARSEEAYSRGDVEDAKQWARWAVGKSPYDEPSFRRYMEFLGRSGDRASAIQAYSEFAIRLENDLGITPSVETTSLVESLRVTAAAAPSSASSIVPQQTRQTPSVADVVEDDESAVNKPEHRPRISVGTAVTFGLALLAIGYLTIRALGVGAQGTLISRGLLETRDEILVADFESHGTDSLLGHALTEAVKIDLSQSRVVRLVNDDRIGSTLRLMAVDTEQPLGADVARDLAQRLGVKAIVRGDITPVGNGYLLSLSLLTAHDGTLLWADRTDVPSTEELIRAVGVLTRRARSEIGEPLREVRATGALEAVTTGSIEALKMYSEGRRIVNFRNQETALPLFERAVQLDSTFAMAYQFIARVVANTGGSRTRYAEAIEKAFLLRHRATEIERLWIESNYFALTGASDQALNTWHALTRLQPNASNWWNNIGHRIGANLVARFPDHEQGISLLDRSFELCQCAFPLGNLTVALITAGMTDSAQSVIDANIDRFPEMPSWQLLRAARAYADGELARAVAELEEDGRLVDVSRVMAVQGRLAESRATFHRWIQERGRHAPPGTYLNLLAIAEVTTLLHGGSARTAAAHVEEVLTDFPLADIPPLDRPYVSVAELFVRAGMVDRAEGLMREYDEVVDTKWQAVTNWRRLLVLGLIDQEKFGSERALPVFEESVREAHAFLAPLPDYGFALASAGEADSAIAVLQRFIGPSPRYASWDFDSLWKASVLVRVGELLEERGDTADALVYYQQFVELWQNADPDLLLQVEDVRRRIARLITELPSR